MCFGQHFTSPRVKVSHKSVNGIIYSIYGNECQHTKYTMIRHANSKRGETGHFYIDVPDIDVTGYFRKVHIFHSRNSSCWRGRQTTLPKTHTKIYLITVINLTIRVFSWTIILDSFSIKLKPKLGLWTIFCNQSYKSSEIFQAKPVPKQNSKLYNKNPMTLPDLNRTVKHCSLLSEFKVR